MVSVNAEIGRLCAVRAIQAALLELKWLRAATRFEIAARRYELALKAGFRPDQLRVPKGEDGAGEWADEGGGGRRSPRLTQLAGDIPTGDTPEVPKQRPPTSRGRTAAMKTAARYGGAIGKLIEGAAWLRDRSPIIQSYRDPPKTLEELQQGAYEPKLGYDVHHIVEQTQARDDGFTKEQFDAPENRVLIPKMKHWDINGWYQKENSTYGGETPRDYLSGRSWAVKRAVGLEALRKFGVLKP